MRLDDVKVGALIRWTGAVTRGYGPNGLITRRFGDDAFCIWWLSAPIGTDIPFSLRTIMRECVLLTQENINDPVDWIQ